MCLRRVHRCETHGARQVSYIKRVAIHVLRRSWPIVHVEIARRLGHRDAALLDQPNRLDLELTRKLPSLHLATSGFMKTPNLGVHETGSRPISFRLGAPVVAPPGAVEEKVDRRTQEIREQIVVPAELDRQDAKAFEAARQAITRDRAQARLAARQKEGERRQADVKQRWEAQVAEGEAKLAELQAQARRDHDAANEAKALAAK